MIDEMSLRKPLSMAEILKKVTDRFASSDIVVKWQTVGAYLVKMSYDGRIIQYHGIGIRGGKGYKLNPKMWKVAKHA